MKWTFSRIINTRGAILVFSMVIAFQFWTLVSMSGCAALQPRPGDVCKENDAVCQKAGHALVCRGGKYVLTSCGGPASCSMASDRTVSCDQTVGANSGEVCLPNYEGQAECVSGAGFVSCTSGTWTGRQCAVGICIQQQEKVVCQ